METPALSVIVPAVRGSACLDECLRALESQAAPGGIEVLVVSRLPEGEAEAVAGGYSRARVVPGGGLTIPQMRAKGIGEARAGVIAVLAEHVRPVAGWAAAILRVQSAAGASVVGGPVSLERATASGWAAFFCEYSEHMTPMPEGEVKSLSGANAAYPRSAIAACADLLPRGVWDGFLHEALAAKGFAFRCANGAEVVVTRRYSPGAFAVEKWRIARSWAAMRARRMGSTDARLRAALASVLVPPLMLWRIARRVRARPGRGYGAKLVLAFPLLAMFLPAWMLGEFTGYLFGEGSSTMKVV